MNIKFFSILPLLVFVSVHIFATSKLSPITEDIPPSEDLTIIQPIDELTMLDHYIEATADSLAHAKALRTMIDEYQKLQAHFAKDTENHAVALEMIKAAHRIRKHILSQNLKPLFHKDFLNELALFSNMATKKGIPQL